MTHNITAQELAFSRVEHDSFKISYNEEKKILNQKNIFNEAFRFARRSLYPLLVPFHYCVLYMVQSSGSDYFFITIIILFQVVTFYPQILSHHIKNWITYKQKFYGS